MKYIETVFNKEFDEVQLEHIIGDLFRKELNISEKHTIKLMMMLRKLNGGIRIH